MTLIQLSKCNSSNDTIIIFAYKIVISILSYMLLMNHILSSSDLGIYSCLILHLFWCGISFTQKQRLQSAVLSAPLWYSCITCTNTELISLSAVFSSGTFAFGVGFDDSERVLWWEEEADLHLRLLWATAAVKLVNTGVHIAELSSQTTEEPQRVHHNHYRHSRWLQMISYKTKYTFK